MFFDYRRKNSNFRTIRVIVKFAWFEARQLNYIVRRSFLMLDKIRQLARLSNILEWKTGEKKIISSSEKNIQESGWYEKKKAVFLVLVLKILIGLETVLTRSSSPIGTVIMHYPKFGMNPCKYFLF